MTATSIPALLEPIQNRLNGATPGPWTDALGKTFKAVGSIADARFIVNAPTDQARLLAAIQAVSAVHQPVTLWMAHEDADVSYQSKEDLLAERTDLTEADLVPFELCGHCKMIEDGPCEGECTMQAGYRESLWPCPTLQAVVAALGGEA